MEGAGRSLIGRAMLAVALWAGFRLLALGIVAALFAVPWFELRSAGTLTFAGIAAGIGGFMVLVAVRPRFPRQPRPSERRQPLDPSMTPELRRFVEDVAKRCESKAPAEIQLADSLNAFIGADRGRFGLRRSLTVGLGLPLFSILEREELAAVLAHEFGHHRGGDLALGPWVYRTRLTLAGTIDALDDSAFLLDAPFRAYGRLFVRATAAVSRRQELEADAHAAALGGSPALAGALRKLEAFAPAWTAFLELDLLPAIELGGRMPVFDGFRHFLAATRRRPEVENVVKLESARAPAEWDTHPPLAERLAALGHASTDGGVVRPSGPGCADLAGGEGALETAWYARVLREPLPHVTWEEAGGKLLLPTIEQRLAAAGLDPAKGTPPELPALAADPLKLWDTVTRQTLQLASPESRRRKGLQLAADWLTAVLSRRGFSVRAMPAEPVLACRDGIEIDPHETVTSLASGALTAAAWSSRCRWELG